MADRIRITYFTNANTMGGAEEYLHLLIEGLDRTKYDVRFVCTEKDGLAPLLRRLTSLEVRVQVLCFTTRGKTGRPSFRDWLALRRFFRNQPTDILHFNLPEPFACRFAIIAAGLAHVPVIVTTNHLPTLTPDHYTWKGRAVLRFAHRWVDLTLVESDINRQAVLSNYRLDPTRTATVYHGIDVKRFDRSYDRQDSLKELGLKPTHKVIGTVGRLSPQKDHHTFLEAAVLIRKRYDEAKFVIVGEGELHQELEQQTRRLGLSEDVLFTGYRDDVAKLLGAFDVVVLSSIFEGLPLSILEAMAMSKPVVATRVDGVKEAVVENETGFLVPPRQPPALADAVLCLLQDPAMAGVMGQSGRRRVESLFTRERMVAETEELYRGLLSRNEARMGRRGG